MRHLGPEWVDEDLFFETKKSYGVSVSLDSSVATDLAGALLTPLDRAGGKEGRRERRRGCLSGNPFELLSVPWVCLSRVGQCQCGQGRRVRMT